MRDNGQDSALGNDPRFFVVATFTLEERRYFLVCERPSLSALSERERQALALRAKGLSSKEIAVELQIGFSTARVLLARSARKLGVVKTGEAAVMYTKLEATPPELPGRDEPAHSCRRHRAGPGERR
jgi:DNA-binding CsgD family transcriptional regulator